MAGSLVAPAGGWSANAFAGEFVLPPHKHLEDASGDVEFTHQPVASTSPPWCNPGSYYGRRCPPPT